MGRLFGAGSPARTSGQALAEAWGGFPGFPQGPGPPRAGEFSMPGAAGEAGAKRAGPLRGLKPSWGFSCAGEFSLPGAAGEADAQRAGPLRGFRPSWEVRACGARPPLAGCSGDRTDLCTKKASSGCLVQMQPARACLLHALRYIASISVLGPLLARHHVASDGGKHASSCISPITWRGRRQYQHHIQACTSVT